MRVRHSLLNIAVGLGNQVIITTLSFVSRTVFITYLGIEYLGISGLFTSILAMLALAEAGIGSSIMYSLYKPVAENDQRKINALMRLYRQAYLIIAIIVFVLGLSFLPFLGFFINETNVDNIHLIYFIFLLNTVLPYLYLHKHSFLNVCQKTYIVTGVFSISSILSVLLKIVILFYTQNFILYLVVESVIVILTSLYLAGIVNRMYPSLKEKVADKIDGETKNNIIKNIKAIVLQNIGVYLIFGTDNIIISSFISVTAVGIYANYHMVIEICRTFINQVFNNIYHSVGNLVAKESKEKIYSIYKVTLFVNFWLYSVFAILLLVMLEPFISIWIGKEYLMSKYVLIILMFIFFERGMRNSITTVKTTSGIFHEDRFAPLIQAAINLVISIYLVKKIGILGVFIGTLVSSILVPFWLTPYLVYKKIFEKPLINYFLRYIFFATLTLVTFTLTNYIVGLITITGLFSFLVSGVVCFILPNVVYSILFYKTNEFKYLLNILKLLKKKFKLRLVHKTKSVA
ncbi:hypothetical protein ABN702_00740 [Bacillus haimaensis]|uniref:lipopolysaccharide biosynthesis protein n=1 Tax=Bacillus haimaensis TaxID=3160967 RepID=UPI003AA8EE66